MPGEDTKREIVLERKTELLSVKLSTTPDRLKLFLECERIEGNPEHCFCRKNITDLIKDSVYYKTLHLEIIDDIVERLNRNEEVKPRRIAKGIPAQKGKDGKLLLLVKPYSKDQKSTQIIDHRFVSLFDNIEEGTVLGRIYPPKPGIEGRDVFGKVLPASYGDPANVQLDDSISLRGLSEDKAYQNFVAKQAGYLTLRNGKYTVADTLEFSGDLDYRIGDIDFVGGVKIRGNVAKGLRVVARKDIEIGGDLFDATLISKQGSIRVRGRIAGSPIRSTKEDKQSKSSGDRNSAPLEHARIEAADSVTAAILLNATVEADCSIEITKEVVNSTLNTQGGVRVPAGRLVGGNTHVTTGVEARTIGTEGEVVTRIYLCRDIESSPEHRSLTLQIETHEIAEKTILLYLGPYSQDSSQSRRLEQEHRHKVEQLKAKLARLQKSLETLREKRQKLLEDAQYAPSPRVNFHKSLFRGVVVHAGEERFTPKEEITGKKSVEFLPDENKFEVVEFKPLEQVKKEAK